MSAHNSQPPSAKLAPSPGPKLVLEHAPHHCVQSWRGVGGSGGGVCVWVGGGGGWEGRGREGGGGCGRDNMTIVFVHETPMHALNWCGRTPGSQTPGVPVTPSHR